MIRRENFLNFLKHKRFKESKKDTETLIKKFGAEFLADTNAKYEPRDMESLEEEFRDTDSHVREAIQLAFNGYRYLPNKYGDKQIKEPFNPNDEYYVFNSYGNLVSIMKDDLEDYLKDKIDEFDFMEWYNNYYGED